MFLELGVSFKRDYSIRCFINLDRHAYHLPIFVLITLSSHGARSAKQMFPREMFTRFVHCQFLILLTDTLILSTVDSLFVEIT